MADVKGNTPLWSFRVPSDLRAQAMACARERGDTVTDVVLRALREYITPPTADAPQQSAAAATAALPRSATERPHSQAPWAPTS